MQEMQIQKPPKTWTLFPLLIASPEVFCAYAKTVFYSALLPRKLSYFASELQQMQWEHNQLEFQERPFPLSLIDYDVEFSKFYALAAQEMDTKFFACEVWPKLLGGQLPA